MGVDMKVKAIYDSEIGNITRSEKNWKDVLKVAGQLYRYEFDNIVMITAQRPPEKSTLMADYDTWKKVGRYVKRGAKGCAIFPSRALNPRMRYIFDISDTGGKNVKLTWDLEGENLKDYVDFLVSEGQIEQYDNSNRESLKNILKQFTGTDVWLIIKEEFGDRMTELMQLSGSVIKEESKKRNGLQQEMDMEQLVYASVMYAVGTRCGFDLSVQEQDFSQIVNIKDEEIIYRLGSIVCDVSCSVLREFSRNLKAIESERRIGYVRRNDLQGSGRTALSADRDAGRDGGSHEAGQIRKDGDELSQRERAGKIQDADEIREDVREDVSGRGGSESAVRPVRDEARLLGTDARLIDKDAPNNPDGKLNKVAENVWKEYEKGNANGHIGCQLIFSDIGTPGPDKDFTIYDYLKETLIQYGIPAEEIAFIHDAKTDAQRDALFKEMRTGKKKVLIGSTDKCGTGVNVQTHLVAMHHVDCPWKPSSIEQREGRGIRQGNENEEVAIYRYVTKGTFDAYNWSLVENKQRFISQVMTSKAVSRSCEDIDEATLSYAEIKAVATGNPLIKEKMEIDNDVQRLKLLKASYDNQRYGLQDNFMIKYPKLIKTATEKLANVREDVKARDKELIDNPEFAITIGKATYTERVDGGTMMLEAISKCKTGETTAIGKFHGFELLVEKNFLGINYMVLRGKTEYKAELSTSPVGSMVKLENLFNGLHENIDFLEKKIEQYQNDLEASKAEYDKPFAYSEELNEKLARQCELNAQLDLENAKAVDADLSGPEEEREADDRMESAAIVAEDKGAYQADREGRTR